MLLPYRIQPNSHKRKQKVLNRKNDLEKPQMTSSDLKRPQFSSKESSQKVEVVKPESNADCTVTRTTNKKKKLKSGAKFEINDNYSDKTLHKINF